MTRASRSRRWGHALVGDPIAVQRRVAESLLVARRMVARLRRRVVRVGAFEIPYLEGGRGDLLVLVHGFSDSKDSFVDVARSLTASHRVVLPDLLGFAEASRPIDFEYSLDRFVEVFAAFIDALGLERFDLGGNSLGGAISAAYAVRFPERVRSLMLLGSAGVPMPRPSALQRRIEAGDNPFVCETLRDHEELLRLVFERPPLLPRPVRLHMAHESIERAPMNAKILDDLLAEPPDLTPVLGDVRAPTLVVWGNRDRLIDVSAGEVFHRGIPDARFVILHGVGHCPQYETPGATSRILHRFIARTRVRRR
jgi:abhydrolase domain-containing protein 6